jgi:anti-anti-sigma factor
VEAMMNIRCCQDEEIDGAVVAAPSGTLDVRGADDLWHVVTAELDSTTPSLMVDLAMIDLITSAGIGILVRLLHRVQSLGGSMVVFGASPRVREVIEIVMLSEIFKLCDTIGEARQRL